METIGDDELLSLCGERGSTSQEKINWMKVAHDETPAAPQVAREICDRFGDLFDMTQYQATEDKVEFAWL
jgi:hypothetical protein